MMNSGKAAGSFIELEQNALAHEAAHRFEDAREAFDAALALNPSSQSSAEGRARVALALRENDAVVHCARALAFHDEEPERQLRMITTAAVELGDVSIPLFVDYLSRHPESAAAHEALAEIRAEAGAGDDFADSYLAALRGRPNSKALLFSYWNTLTRAGCLQEALDRMEEHRSSFEGDRDFALLEVNIASHAGLTDRVGELIDRLDDAPDAMMARGQYHLQSGRPKEAADFLESVLRQQPDNASAWALIEVAWRILQDPRHAWLIGDPPLFEARDLELSKSQLDEIASALRTMHRAQAQPIGQSLRGGTQTSGQLFLRPEPEISLLTNALASAIRLFFNDLPAADPSHPFLRHRNMGMAFGPSWSVRFTGTGHHASHFHPNGVLSSACYIHVPETISAGTDKDGWLEIGRPPPELKLDLTPLATFEPKPGRLVLFPSFLFHGTRPFTGGERLSVAFDLVPVPMD